MGGLQPPREKIYNRESLDAFNLLVRHPIWVFDIERKGIWWANHTACEVVWNAPNLDSLRKRDFAIDMSATTERRLLEYWQRFQRGETIEDQWTLHPQGVATTCFLTMSGILVDDGDENENENDKNRNGLATISRGTASRGRMCMFVEGGSFDIKEHTDKSLRGVEMLRHLPVAVCQFDLKGQLMYQNPESVELFGLEDPADDCPFLSRFADKDLGRSTLRTITNRANNTFPNIHLSNNNIIINNKNNNNTTSAPASPTTPNKSSTAAEESSSAPSSGKRHPPSSSSNSALEKDNCDGIYCIEAQQMTKSGELRWCSISLRVSKDPVTSESIILQSIRDTTDVIEAKQAADRASAEKSEFLAVMAHELRTPLHQVIGFIELLTQTTLNPQQAEYTGLMQSSSMSLMSVINDLLDYTKIEAGKLNLENIPFEVKGVLEGCLQVVLPKASGKGLMLKLNLPVGLPVKLLGDPNRLRQILLNLLQNAVKFTKRGSIQVSVTYVLDHKHINKTTETSEDNNTNNKKDVEKPPKKVTCLRFAVIDTGIGICPEHQKHIFGKYQQASSAIARQYGGTGLGLSICKSLVEAMGGSISLKSIGGVGTTVQFDVPFEDPPKVTSHAGNLVGGASGGTVGSANSLSGDQQAPIDVSSAFYVKGLKVLVVEDNSMNQKVVKAMLQRIGHFVIIADNGAIGVSCVEREHFDIVLMDVQMPVMDGIEATKHIRSKGYDSLPIVGLTASYQPADWQYYRDIGMNDCIGKPVRLQTLRTTLQNLCCKTAMTTGAESTTSTAPQAGRAPLTPKASTTIMKSEEQSVSMSNSTPPTPPVVSSSQSTPQSQSQLFSPRAVRPLINGQRQNEQQQQGQHATSNSVSSAPSSQQTMKPLFASYNNASSSAANSAMQHQQQQQSTLFSPQTLTANRAADAPGSITPVKPLFSSFKPPLNPSPIRPLFASLPPPRTNSDPIKPLFSSLTPPTTNNEPIKPLFASLPPPTTNTEPIKPLFASLPTPTTNNEPIKPLFASLPPPTTNNEPIKPLFASLPPPTTNNEPIKPLFASMPPTDTAPIKPLFASLPPSNTAPIKPLFASLPSPTNTGPIRPAPIKPLFATSPPSTTTIAPIDGINNYTHHKIMSPQPLSAPTAAQQLFDQGAALTLSSPRPGTLSASLTTETSQSPTFRTTINSAVSNEQHEHFSPKNNSLEEGSQTIGSREIGHRPLFSKCSAIRPQQPKAISPPPLTPTRVSRNGRGIILSQRRSPVPISASALESDALVFNESDSSLWSRSISVPSEYQIAGTKTLSTTIPCETYSEESEGSFDSPALCKDSAGREDAVSFTPLLTRKDTSRVQAMDYARAASAPPSPMAKPERSERLVVSYYDMHEMDPPLNTEFHQEQRAEADYFDSRMGHSIVPYLDVYQHGSLHNAGNCQAQGTEASYVVPNNPTFYGLPAGGVLTSYYNQSPCTSSSQTTASVQADSTSTACHLPTSSSQRALLSTSSRRSSIQTASQSAPMYMQAEPSMHSSQPDMHTARPSSLSRTVSFQSHSFPTKQRRHSVTFCESAMVETFTSNSHIFNPTNRAASEPLPETEEGLKRAASFTTYVEDINSNPQTPELIEVTTDGEESKSSSTSRSNSADTSSDQLFLQKQNQQQQRISATAAT